MGRATGDFLISAAKAAVVLAVTGNPYLAAIVFTTSLYGANRTRVGASRAKQRYNDSQRDRAQMIRSATAPRTAVIGRERVSGPIAYLTTTGSQKQFLHVVVALAGHECDGIESVYFNDVQLPAPDGAGMIQSGAFYKPSSLVDVAHTAVATSTIALPTTKGTPQSIVSVTKSVNAPGSANEGYIGALAATDYTLVGATLTILGSTTTSYYYTVNFKASPSGKALVRIKTYTGNQTAADPDLIAESGGEWTAAHVGFGIPYVYARLEFDSDVFAQVGIPNISVVMRGAKLYDPRRNLCYCADMAGGVVGTPGTFPSGGDVNVSNGLARTIVGYGTDPSTGMPYVDVRLFGTATANNATGGVIYLPTPTYSSAAAVGQAWSSRVWCRVLAMTTTHSVMKFQLMSYTSANAGTVEKQSDMLVGATVANGLQKFEVLNATLAGGASVAKAGARITFGVNIGVAYDTTIRVMLPQVYRAMSDPSVWTDNAALAVAWWLRHPMLGVGSDWSSVITAELSPEANVCDETVPLVSGSQSRYTTNGVIRMEGALRDNLDTLLEPMAGTAAWIQGRWRVRAGAYETPDLTIDESCLAQGAISIIPRVARRDLFNSVTGTYSDASSNYAERQYPAVTNVLYQLEDGGRVVDSDLPQPMVKDGIRAQRLAKIRLEGVRSAMRVSLTTNMKGYAAMPGGTVYLTLSKYGIVAKPMLVLDRTYNPGTRRIALTMIETAPGLFAWNYGLATTVDPAPNSTLPSVGLKPTAPAGLVAAFYTVRLGTGFAQIPLTSARLTWTQSADPRVLQGGKCLVQYKRDDADFWTDAGVIDGASVSTAAGPLDNTRASVVRVCFVNSEGRASDWTTVPVTAPAVGVGAGVQAGAILSPNAKSWAGFAAAMLAFTSTGVLMCAGATPGQVWFAGTTTGAGYWIRATKISGSIPSGDYNTWLALTSTRQWSLTSTGGVDMRGTVRFEIATDSAGASIVATYTANFFADSTNDTGGGGGYNQP